MRFFQNSNAINPVRLDASLKPITMELGRGFAEFNKGKVLGIIRKKNGLIK